jgi:RNA polymerase sigma-70 factor (ECF subfamily)
MPHDATRAAAGDHLPAGRGLDREEFAGRFQAASRVLWTIAAAVLGDPSRAEDVLQEACLIALQKLEHFEPGTSFAAWMGAIVRNVARNESRKGARRATRPMAPDELAEFLPEAEPREASNGAALVDERGVFASGHGALDDDLDRALAELRPIQRAALLLRTLRGLDYAEISAVLDIPQGTAMSHVHRARQALRRRLSPKATITGAESEDGAA